jgi:hypothetical protein
MSSMPRCWDTERNWAEWNRLNEQTGSAPGKPLDHYCTDCTPDYKERMCAAGRCGYPDVVFSAVLVRRVNPATGRTTLEQSGTVRGWRNAEDEATWAKRHAIRVKEKTDGTS